MKKLSIFIILLMCLLPMNAQQVTIKDVANATYRAEGIRGIRPMLDGEHYTQISSDGKRLVKYSFKTGKEVATIFDVETARDCTIKHFDDYIMSPNESLILIQTDTKPIYRNKFPCSRLTATRLPLYATTTSIWSNSCSTTANHRLPPTENTMKY